jgi:peptidyl-dipeptidase Dcp
MPVEKLNKLLFESPNFDELTINYFKTHIPEAINQHLLEIEKIKNYRGEPSFENTVVALENSGKALKRLTDIIFNLNAAHSSNELQEYVVELSPTLSKHYDSILFDAKLFEKVKQVYETLKDTNLSPEDKTLLENTFLDFKRNGALLSDVEKISLSSINEKLGVLSLRFSQNILNETNNYSLAIDGIDKLAGLPQYVIDSAKEDAEKQNLPGKFLFTLHAPSFIPFITYAENRALRKEMFLNFSKRGFNQNDYNNEEIISELVKLRNEKAQILGYNSFADYILEKRMAKTTENVKSFLNELALAAKPAALQDLNLLENEAKNYNYNRVEPWDRMFLTEKIRERSFNLSDKLLKPFFELGNVLNGVFKTAELLFGLTFNENNTIKTYHPDVKAYDVKNSDGEIISTLFTDFFQRASKKSGAWMTSYRNYHVMENKTLTPIISIVCNFSKPTKTEPSLLTFDEVKTLFHEFGHALHGMLGKGTYESLTGTNVYWDFVELPSQIMENWCFEPQCLNLFAKHYISGEPIDANYIEKIKAASNFMEGFNTFRQISFANLDLAWHSGNYSNEGVYAFEKMVSKEFELIKSKEKTCMSTAFSHIFAGGYAAGYYSYKWAEVLDADAFELFKERGIFNKGVAEKFKSEILEKGGAEHPEKLYFNFKGKKPSIKPLINRAGLTK